MLIFREFPAILSIDWKIAIFRDRKGVAYMLEKANATPFLRKSLQIQKIMLSLQKIITSQGEIYEIPYWNTDI